MTGGYGGNPDCQTLVAISEATRRKLPDAQVAIDYAVQHSEGMERTADGWFSRRLRVNVFRAEWEVRCKVPCPAIVPLAYMCLIICGIVADPGINADRNHSLGDIFLSQSNRIILVMMGGWAGSMHKADAIH